MHKLRVEQSRCGTIKLKHDLAKDGISIGRDRLFSLLRRENLLVKRKKKHSRTTYSNHSYATSPNLIKNLEVAEANQVFVSDITYIRLRKHFAYLFLVSDLYTRKIVGYHLSRDLSSYSAALALRRALLKVAYSDGIIHHSDRGSQYCCHDFKEYLAAHKMQSSMTDDNHVYQNATAERINGILKDEFDLDATFDNFQLAQNCVERSIYIYNNKRAHRSLNLQTPAEAYASAA